MMFEMDLDGQTVTVEYTITPGEPDYRNGHPDNWTPGYDPEVEMTVYEDGHEIELEADDEAMVERMCLLHSGKMADAQMSWAAEY